MFYIYGIDYRMQVYATFFLLLLAVVKYLYAS